MTVRGRGILVRRRAGHQRFWVASWPHLLPRHGAALLGWAREHRRAFPWRDNPSPFAKLVGEMLLRKTSARHALQAYAALITLCPTARELVEADDEELTRLLTPLGMVRQRIHGLRAMARFLLDHYEGQVPASPEELMRIPHVGRYTANAVCSFAFGLPLPIVDTNVARVLTRFTGRGKTGPRSHTKEPLWKRMALSLPEGQVDEFNYGLLDLGATVCRPEPQCAVCPLQGACVYARKRKGVRPDGLTP